MRKKIGFFVRAILFLVIFGLLFTPLKELTARKSLTGAWDMTNKVGGFYNEPEDEFEVMFFGSSHAYAAFSPLRLWEDTGVKSYVFATQRQPLWATYAYMKDAFQRQSPSLAVVECNMAMDTEEYYDEGVTYSYMDDMPFSLNKVRLAWVSAPDMEERVELLCNFIKYHGRWTDLEDADYEFDRKSLRDPYKGYVFLEPQETEQPRPAIETVSSSTPLLEKNEYWLRKIIALCEKEGVPLWLVKSPSNLTLEEKGYLNTVAAIAAECGVPFDDFNEKYDEIGLAPSFFYDEHHLDARGAAKYTDWFAAELLARYPSLVKRLEDGAWQADAEGYEDALRRLS